MQDELSQRKFAKRLVTICTKDGQVDDERVAAALSVLKTKPVRELVPLLKYFQFYLARELRHSQIRIEHAGKLRQSTLEKLQKNLSQKYQRQLTVTASENPKLIAGLRVAVGDDVYDSTVTGRLAALRNASASY